MSLQLSRTVVFVWSRLVLMLRIDFSILSRTIIIATLIQKLKYKTITGRKLLSACSTFTPSTRRQRAKARRSREMLRDEISNTIERELTYTICSSNGHNDTDAFSDNTGNSSQKNEIDDFNVENKIAGHDRCIESMEFFSNEISMRLSQKMDLLISLMHFQIKWAISSAISERLILVIQNVMVRYLQDRGTLRPKRLLIIIKILKRWVGWKQN